MRTTAILLALATGITSSPVAQDLQARRLLGSSFGVPGNNRTFDYVVIGGGVGGLTIATRLVEQKAGTVAVIEAGTFYEISNGNLSQIPASDYMFTGKDQSDWHPGIDWGYISEPQKVLRFSNVTSYDKCLHKLHHRALIMSQCTTLEAKRLVVVLPGTTWLTSARPRVH